LSKFKDDVRRAITRIRWAVWPVRIRISDDPSLKILEAVKLFRDIRIGDTTYRGAHDTGGRTINYVFSLLPKDAFVGKDVLDVGSAGGSACFEAIARGSRRAVAVEISERSLRGGAFHQASGAHPKRQVRFTGLLCIPPRQDASVRRYLRTQCAASSGQSFSDAPADLQNGSEARDHRGAR